MYRYVIEGEEWIVRFSPQASFEKKEKEAIIQSIKHIESKLATFTHGDAFLVVDKAVGTIVFRVERIPSFIINVCNIIPEDRCYVR